MPGGENRQTFMFSATFPPEIQTLAREFLRNYVWIAVGRVGSTVENIKQQVLLASADPQEKIKLLMSVLDQTDGRTLIFVQKRKTASWLCDTLRNMFGIAAEEIHGDRSQAQRESALKAFRDGNIRILVATVSLFKDICCCLIPFNRMSRLEDWMFLRLCMLYNSTCP